MNNKLYHSGVKGMRWGIRRYQNADGTLTEEGKERYKTGYTLDGDKAKFRDSADNAQRISGVSSNISKAARDASSLPFLSSNNKTAHPDYSKMSDDELKNRVNRLNLEESYARLKGESKPVTTGKDIVREVLQSLGIVAAIGASAASIYAAIKSKGA